jgi:lambda family phage portal protein
MTRKRRIRQTQPPAVQAGAATGAAGGTHEGIADQPMPMAWGQPMTSSLYMRSAFGMWAPGLRDADGTDWYERRDQRAHCRDLDRTAPIASAAINRHVEYRGGMGLRLQCAVDHEELGITEEAAAAWKKKTEKRFHMWAASKFATVSGELDFYQAQRLSILSQELSGDVGIQLVKKERGGWPFRLALQLIEADRICNKDGSINTSTLHEGVQRNKDGEIEKFWIANHHPGSINVNSDKGWTEIDQYGPNGELQFILRRRIRRPGSSRGMPRLGSIIDTIKGLDDYTESEITGARNAAKMTLAAMMDFDSFEALFGKETQDAEQYKKLAIAARENSTAWTDGQLIHLLPGEKLESPTPGRPNPAHQQFWETVLKICAMGTDIPPEIVKGLFESSYTAARAAREQWWQTISIDRYDDAADLCKPIYQEWLADAVALGIIEAPGFFADPFIRHAWSGSDWHGTTAGSLDPLKEALAAEKRAAFLTSEHEEALAFNGGNWDDKHLQRVREARARERDGLPPLGAKPADTVTDQPMDGNTPGAV